MLRPHPFAVAHAEVEAVLRRQAAGSMPFFVSILQGCKAELTGRRAPALTEGDKVHVPEVLVMNGVVVPGCGGFPGAGFEQTFFNRQPRDPSGVPFHS